MATEEARDIPLAEASHATRLYFAQQDYAIAWVEAAWASPSQAVQAAQRLEFAWQALVALKAECQN